MHFRNLYYHQRLNSWYFISAQNREVQARASLCSVSGKEMAVNMCYRSLYIGTGDYYSLAAGNASSYSVQYNYVLSLQVLIWTCALQTTGIVTTFQGNMPVYFMMRYAILNIWHALRTKEVIYVYIHLFSPPPEYKAVWTVELQRTRDDRRQCIIFLWLLWEDEPESIQQPASESAECHPWVISLPVPYLKTKIHELII